MGNTSWWFPILHQVGLYLSLQDGEKTRNSCPGCACGGTGRCCLHPVADETAASWPTYREPPTSHEQWGLPCTDQIRAGYLTAAADPLHGPASSGLSPTSTATIAHRRYQSILNDLHQRAGATAARFVFEVWRRELRSLLMGTGVLLAVSPGPLWSWGGYWRGGWGSLGAWGWGLHWGLVSGEGCSI